MWSGVRPSLFFMRNTVRRPRPDNSSVTTSTEPCMPRKMHISMLWGIRLCLFNLAQCAAPGPMAACLLPRRNPARQKVHIGSGMLWSVDLW
eukprot:1159129-Pelagomonas_calceolata.AAC.11